MDEENSQERRHAPRGILAGTLACWLGWTAVAEGPGGSLQLDPATLGHVNLGVEPGLGLNDFTIETWFRIDGPGIVVGSGFGLGTYVAPLIAKGRNELPDNSNRDVNYLFGVRSDNHLGVDFESTGWGANLPMRGEREITLGAWHHAAATYDGTVLRLYLDGSLDGWLVGEVTPRADTVQPVGFGTAFDASGQPEGYFDGRIDEVRIWDHARTEAEIRAAINQEIESAPGLIGRWGMNEPGGPDVLDSSGHGHHGVLIGATRVEGAPFDLDLAPDTPAATFPPDAGTVATGGTQFQVEVHDPELTAMAVTFRARPRQPLREGAFNIVVLPDTQLYVEFQSDLAHIFEAQTQWAADHYVSDNVALVAHVGDIVHNDLTCEWEDADAAISILDTHAELPYVLGVGNHDETPFGDPFGTENFNLFFPYTRYEDVAPWYGGHFASDNDNHYVLFSAGGEDYVAIAVEYNATFDALEWADAVLKAYPDRRGIVVSHTIIYPGVQAGFTNPNLWAAVAGNPNLFLMLCGHVYREGRRVEVVNGNVVHILLSNYQHRHDGGNGHMRLIELAPGDDAIHVRTWSPTLGTFEMDADSDFWLNEDEPGGPWTVLGTVNDVASGATAAIEWTGLEDGGAYEWQVTVSDGERATTGPVWSFEADFGPGDLNGDGVVNVDDLMQVILNWEACPGGPAPCPGDANGDGVVDVLDIVMVVLNWD